MIIYFRASGQRRPTQRQRAKGEKRPLDREGMRQAYQVGRLLAALDVEIDIAISSPLKRVIQTASLAVNEIDYEQKVERDSAAS